MISILSKSSPLACSRDLHKLLRTSPLELRENKAKQALELSKLGYTYNSIMNAENTWADQINRAKHAEAEGREVGKNGRSLLLRTIANEHIVAEFVK